MEQETTSFSELETKQTRKSPREVRHSTTTMKRNRGKDGWSPEQQAGASVYLPLSRFSRNFFFLSQLIVIFLLFPHFLAPRRQQGDKRLSSVHFFVLSFFFSRSFCFERITICTLARLSSTTNISAPDDFLLALGSLQTE